MPTRSWLPENTTRTGGVACSRPIDNTRQADVLVYLGAPIDFSSPTKEEIKHKDQGVWSRPIIRAYELDADSLSSVSACGDDDDADDSMLSYVSEITKPTGLSMDVTKFTSPTAFDSEVDESSLASLSPSMQISIEPPLTATAIYLPYNWCGL
jgi:hypothetical protein